MSKVAICNAESGQLTDICDEADKFAIYEGPDATLKWVDVPEDTTYEHFMCNGVVIHRETTEDLRVNATVDRILAYGDFGEQMDMQYRDALNGTTEWKDHVANVKATTTKPSTIAAFVEDEKKVQLVGRKSWDPWVDGYTPPVG
jgi:glycogen debranching enzyme|tara:strand:+ start:4993 stop:5424 length:432 start_codon:yes stop_codon:yes gene_type:complete